MSHFGDLMDGVPVKISEKYKRPPRIDLPYSVIECPQRAQNVIDNIKYCSTFERNVLSKLKELRTAKETKKNERRYRLQLLEEEKQKKIDAIAAAEAEEKLKQLSISEVSYPSTEEISAMSSDEKIDKNCDTSPIQDNTQEVDKSTGGEPYTYSRQESQPNILQPVQVQTSIQPSLLDDPDPLQGLKMNTKLMKMGQYNRNVDMLTFRDFENDNSSPFDNVELKTINDMELLAQVLQRDSSTNCPVQPVYMPDQTYMNYTNCATQAQMEGMTYLPNAYMEQTIQGPSVSYSSPQHFPVTNGYYIAPDNACDNVNVPMENLNMQMPNYQYYVPAQVVPSSGLYYSNQLPTTSPEVSHVNNGSTYIPQPYYFSYPHVPVDYTTPEPNYNMNDKSVENQNPSISSQNMVKSRSRSVPDIVKELNEEVVSAKLRASERSCNASPAPPVPRTSSNSEKKERRRRKIEQLPNPYDKFPSKLQIICEKIHGMGFPLDRVARVCSLVGDNDKKIIEGLLILGELMDLGFSEGKASAALAKHEFNRDKALDELVS